MTPTRWLALALLWFVLLAIAGWWIGSHLQLTGDLRKFMPAQDTTGRGHIVNAARAACASEAPTAFCAGSAGLLA